MTQIVEPPPGPVSEEPKRTGPRIWVWVWFWEDPDTRSVKIGIVATVIVHLILFLTLPHLLTTAPLPRYRGHHTSPIHIRLVQPPAPTPPPDHEHQQFVEANPNAPANKPDHTNNFSDRNQQAAQEHPTAHSKSDRPTLKGRKDIHSNQIVDGRLVPPTPPVPPTPRVTQTQQKQTPTPKHQQNPLSGTERDFNPNVNGIGTNIAKEQSNNRPLPNRIDGTPDATADNSQIFTAPAIDPRHPQPRRTLDTFARPAVFEQNQFGTSNLGVTAIDARFNQFGVYLQRLVDAVQEEWDRILEGSNIYPPPGSTVQIRFTINSKGQISAIVKVDPSASCTEPATKACEAAITTPAPYGPWTDDMIAMLGNQQDLIFTFLYE